MDELNKQKSFFLIAGVCIASVFVCAGCNPPTAKCSKLSAPLPEITPDDPGRVIGESEDEISFIYDQSEFRTFEIRLEQDDLDTLDADPVAEQYVPGTLVFDGTEYGPVGVRYKGSVGAWVRCTANSTNDDPLNVGGAKTCPKLNLKVSFNEYDTEGRFFGVKKLLFHAMNGDESMMRERLGYWLFRHMGVPAPRAVHVRLLVNGKYEGVFINVEYIDGRFTRSRFSDGKGNLYKEIWPTSIKGQTAPLTAKRLLGGLRTNEDENPSVDKMLSFNRAVMKMNGDARAKAIIDWMSVDNTMRYIAVDRTIRADDGIVHFYCFDAACGNHNFYIYEEEHANRVWLIPWDLDNAFVIIGDHGDWEDKFLKVVNEWDDHKAICRRRQGAESWSPRQMPPSCDPLVNGCGCYFKDKYYQVLSELLDGPFSANTVNDNIETWQAQITDAVDEAYKADSRQLSPKEWQTAIANFHERIKILRAQAHNS